MINIDNQVSTDIHSICILFDGYKFIRALLRGMQNNHGTIAALTERGRNMQKFQFWVLTRFCHVSGCAVHLFLLYLTLSVLWIPFPHKPSPPLTEKQKARFAGNPLLSHASCPTAPLGVPNSPVNAVIIPTPWNFICFWGCSKCGSRLHT